jgi:haloacetate dehalogenase
MFFPGFTLEHIPVSGGGNIRLRRGGSGPPLLLLHGNPQTHAMWNAVAPGLAEKFSVVCPDLRGYGGSLKPPATPDHAPYAKRVMARDMVEVMERLGHRRFRLAFAMGYYHWFWFAQPHPFPEVLISAAPETWFKAHTTREQNQPWSFHAEALADYLAAARNPDMIRGMCEDYRAAATIDLEHDRESRAAGARIQCPFLVLWGAKAKIPRWYDPLAIWYAAADVAGAAIASGHYLAEEAPDAVTQRLLAFFA